MAGQARWPETQVAPVTVGAERSRWASLFLSAGQVLALAAAFLVPPTVAVAEAAQHLVAVVATAGSAHQPHGEALIAGVQDAARRVNASGGVLGAVVRPVAWSEDCSRERAAQIAAEISLMKPMVVIGHLCAGAALAAAPIYAKAGILFIAPGVRHPALTKDAVGMGPVLRLAGRDDRFATDTVAFIKSRHAGKSIAVIADRTRQARALADGVVAEARRQQVALVLDVRIESGERAYDALAVRVKDSGAGVVVMPAQPIELGVVVASLRRIGVEAPIVGSEILAVPAIEVMARDQGDRLVVMMPWSGLEAGAKATIAVGQDEQAREALRRRAEAALEAWAAAARRAGSTASAAVAAAARGEATATAVGTLRFDDAGDALVRSYVASTWRDGQWRPLGDKTMAQPAAPAPQ